jgi:hypothetical protein
MQIVSCFRFFYFTWSFARNISICSHQTQQCVYYIYIYTHTHTRWFKYDRDWVCVNKSQFVPVIFEPPCLCVYIYIYIYIYAATCFGLFYRPSSGNTLHKTRVSIPRTVTCQRNSSIFCIRNEDIFMLDVRKYEIFVEMLRHNRLIFIKGQPFSFLGGGKWFFSSRKRQDWLSGPPSVKLTSASVADVNNVRHYTFSPPYAFIACAGSFTFTSLCHLNLKRWLKQAKTRL